MHPEVSAYDYRQMRKNKNSPFTEKQLSRIQQLGEVALIQRISEWLGPVSPPTPKGIGDDCAILESPLEGKQIITTDTVTYGQHFDDQVSAENAGAKLIKRNLSDIAAMGGTPESAVLALLCGPDLSIDWLEGFFKGIRSASERYKVALVGGDLSSLAQGNFSAVLTLTGRSTQPRLRQSKHAGDLIYVTGSLGGSILKKHYDFEPRLNEGQWLATQKACQAMMDLTDGLSKDLLAMIPKGCSAALKLENIPVAEDAIELSKQTDRSPLDHAFTDGEDYELLFSLRAKTNQKDFERRWQTAFPELAINCIGQFIESAGTAPLIDSETQQILPWAQGFEHFK